MVDLNEIETLEVQLDALETSMSGTARMGAAFQSGLQDMQTSLELTEKAVEKTTQRLSGGLSSAFEDVVFGGAKLSDALKDVARSMIETTFHNSVSPVTEGISTAITGGLTDLFKGIFTFAEGGTFSNGRVQPFAKGGVVSSPTFFPMRGGTGLMGEAGPEAIMPLQRGADGSLGVKAPGSGGSITVNMNISTPDVNGFRKSRAQIAASMSRAIQRGQRNF